MVRVRWDGNTRSYWLPDDCVARAPRRGAFDRHLRLLRRCRVFLAELNRRSDARLASDPDASRSPEAQRHYDRARRIVRVIDGELRR